MQTIWPWVAFHVFVVGALILDLGVFHKKSHVVNFRESLIWSGIWIALALIFNVGVWQFKGSQAGMEFLTGYLLEWSLSVDNLFVFLTIFSSFAVSPQHQHRVLFWGILGALVMRALFIFGGIQLLNSFHWIVYVFGAILVFTGVKLFFAEEKEGDAKDNYLVRFAKRVLPFTDTYHGGHFLIRQNGRLVGTPLLLVLIVVEVTDVVFALDSIPAVLSVTRDPFIVYTSNVFAILGLRSLYFALAGLMVLFKYLKVGLAFILVFVGIKLAISNFYHVPTAWSLMFVLGTLLLSILASYVVARKK